MSSPRNGAAMQATCIRETSADGLPSYVELETCLEMAADVRSKK